MSDEVATLNNMINTLHDLRTEYEDGSPEVIRYSTAIASLRAILDAKLDGG